MKEIDISDRLIFLAEKFDVFECSDEDMLEEKLSSLISSGYSCDIIKSPKGLEVYAIYSIKTNDKGRTLKKISISDKVFTDMLIADPTKNKQYLQWMLNIFMVFIKSDNIVNAIHLVSEDLSQANTYLTLFEDNKRKQKFKDLCKISYILKGLTDFTDINQYHSLSQLFDAVDPFIEKEPSAVERVLNKMVASGQALIPVKDRKYTLYIPKTRDASVVFSNYVSWCTSSVGNGMFKKYTNDNKKPNGKKSDIYIIIDNDFFTGESQELFQIHFETNQMRGRDNKNDLDLFKSILNQSEGLTNFFYNELLVMSKQTKKELEYNKYLKILITIGLVDNLFDLLDKNIEMMTFMDTKIKTMPDISEFTMISQLTIAEAKLCEIPVSIGKLINLQMLSLPGNSITTIPKEIGQLINLEFFNLNDSPIKNISDSITYLDRANGGSLITLKIKEKDIGAENYKKLKRLLPTTDIN